MREQVTITGSPFRPAAPRDRLASAFIFLIVLAFLAVSCGTDGGSGQEESARAIFERARALQDDGQVIEALKEFDRLAEFPETGAYREAKQFLLAQSISIGSALESWTIKRMFDVKNDLIRKGRDRHPDGEVAIPLPEKDGWGNSMLVRYSNNPNYSFLIISSGKDGKIETEDDLILTNKRNFSGISPSGGTGASDIYASDDKVPSTAPRPDPSANVYAPDDRAPASPPEPDKVPAPTPPEKKTTAEETVDLNDLLEQ